MAECTRTAHQVGVAVTSLARYCPRMMKIILVFALVALASVVATPDGAIAVATNTTSPTDAGWPSDRYWNLVFTLLGGAVAAGTGLFVGLKLHNRQRRDMAGAVATALVAELINIRSILDESVKAGVSDGVFSDLSPTAIYNLKLLQNRAEVFRAILPQIGVLGPGNAGTAVNLYFGLDLLVRDVTLITSEKFTRVSPEGRPLRVRFASKAQECLDRAKVLRTHADELITSLCARFRLRSPFEQQRQ